MRKCPNCNKRTVKAINVKFLSSTKNIECENCNSKIGVSKKWTALISLFYFVFVIILFVLNVPIDKNILRFLIVLGSSGFIMVVIQLFVIPYEVRN